MLYAWLLRRIKTKNGIYWRKNKVRGMELKINKSKSVLQPVWRAVCTNKGPKKLPPIPTATTSFSDFPVAPTYQICLLAEKWSIISKKVWLQAKVHYPRTTSDPLRELLYLVQNFPNIWDYILSITLNNSVPRSTKSYMEYRPILCAVYLKRTPGN